MPFRETRAVEERCAMMMAFDSGGLSVSQLCRHFGVSRETFYYWKRRREADPEHWWMERSRAPGRCPHATAAETIAQLVNLRKAKPNLGPKKLRAKLMERDPQTDWPSTSTIGDILRRKGLIKEKARRRRPLDRGQVESVSDDLNGEWAMDFKGWFRTRSGERCDPFTITDTVSRFLIDVRIIRPAHEEVRQVLLRIFHEIGLPSAIRSDNGAPFGSSGAGGLSRLSVLLLRLGVEPRFIPPSSPQYNGRHERMHRTLKDHTARPPAQTAHEQQLRFDAFRQEFNAERPHEALGFATPASRWSPPTRAMPATIEEPWYDADTQVRRVRPSGEIKWKADYVFIGEALAGEVIGLMEVENGAFIVRFSTRDLGILDRGLRFHRFAPPRWRLRCAAKADTVTT